MVTEQCCDGDSALPGSLSDTSLCNHPAGAHVDASTSANHNSTLAHGTALIKRFKLVDTVYEAWVMGMW